MHSNLAKQRIALLQLYSNGDCLFATIIARQIKVDFADCHLTWYIASNCKGMILNNPDVNDIVEVDTKNVYGEIAWENTNELLIKLKHEGIYDQVFSTQIIGDNEKNYTGTIRSSILKNYPRKITVKTKPYIYLSDNEILNVRKFIESNKISLYKNIVLFECQPLSGQVPVDPVKAEKWSSQALEHLPDSCIILTSGQKIQTTSEHIFDASTLTIRENAELINYCTHLIGCSSGISWLGFSSWCKQIPMIQLMDNHSFYFNSFSRDCFLLNQDSSHIIETRFVDGDNLTKAIISFVTNFQEAKKNYHQILPDHSRTIYSLCRRHIMKGKTNHAFQIIKNTYALNKKSIHYYQMILKLIIMYPLLLLLSLTK